MEQQAEREVVELHRFFQSWFTGEVPREDDHFQRVVDALAEDFFLISPDGVRMDRSAILKMIQGAWGARPPGFSVWIQQVETQWTGNDVVLLTYEEWQSDVADTRGRLASALFRVNEHAPGGVEWVHLHETWLPTGDVEFPG